MIRLSRLEPGGREISGRRRSVAIDTFFVVVAAIVGLIFDQVRARPGQLLRRHAFRHQIMRRIAYRRNAPSIKRRRVDDDNASLDVRRRRPGCDRWCLPSVIGPRRQSASAPIHPVSFCRLSYHIKHATIACCRSRVNNGVPEVSHFWTQLFVFRLSLSTRLEFFCVRLIRRSGAHVYSH